MGKLIVFEGTDGSGKSTQFSLLTRRLEARGVDFRTMVFPQYTEPSSALIRMYLGGEFGARPSDVNAYTASTFYAVDRFAAFRKVWGEYYRNGGLMLSDRYTTSNAVHQASKEPEQDREKFFAWLYDLEYRHMGLPVPDLVLYLDVPTELTGQMLRRREHDTHTHADIHEQNMDYLRRCRAGVEVRLAGIGGTDIPGSHGIPVHADCAAETVDLTQADMLILPGGLGGVRSIRGCEPVLRAAREMAQAGKWVAAICAAPTVLAELGLLEGRRATCYPGMEPEMRGAVMQNAGVVRDGNFITGRAAGSSFAFGLALVEALCGAETAARIAAQVVWNGEEASHD